MQRSLIRTTWHVKQLGICPERIPGVRTGDGWGGGYKVWQSDESSADRDVKCVL